MSIRDKVSFKRTGLGCNCKSLNSFSWLTIKKAHELKYTAMKINHTSISVLITALLLCVKKNPKSRYKRLSSFYLATKLHTRHRNDASWPWFRHEPWSNISFVSFLYRLCLYISNQMESRSSKKHCNHLHNSKKFQQHLKTHAQYE